MMKDRPLVDAVNLIAEAAKGLPDDWSIEFYFDNEDCWFDLINPLGEKVEVYSAECNIAEAIRVANSVGSFVDNAVANAMKVVAERAAVTEKAGNLTLSPRVPHPDGLNLSALDSGD